MKTMILISCGVVTLLGVMLYDGGKPTQKTVLVHGPIVAQRNMEVSQLAWMGYMHKQSTMEDVIEVVIIVHKTHNPETFDNVIGETDQEKAAHLVTSWVMGWLEHPETEMGELAFERFTEVLEDYKRITGREYKTYH